LLKDAYIWRPRIEMKGNSNYMVGVKVKDNESIDRAINRFKKLVTRSRILNEYKENQQYTKPSKERREALKRSIREQRRRDRNRY
jgi:small subunit ribosomal protein S21